MSLSLHSSNHPGQQLQQHYSSSLQQQQKQTCVHCRQSFSLSFNPRGGCPDAPPDCGRRCVERVSCVAAAKCLLYHCMSDAEGDYPPNPCTCSNADGHWARRWLGRDSAVPREE